MKFIVYTVTGRFEIPCDPEQTKGKTTEQCMKDIYDAFDFANLHNIRLENKVFLVRHIVALEVVEE